MLGIPTTLAGCGKGISRVASHKNRIRVTPIDPNREEYSFEHSTIFQQPNVKLLDLRYLIDHKTGLLENEFLFYFFSSFY